MTSSAATEISRCPRRRRSFETTVLAAPAALLLFFAGACPGQAEDRLAACQSYARDYADAHKGSGDPLGDLVDGGMRGVVAGGAWDGPSGAERGAVAGGALSVLDNLGAYPGGWQALYDMAYQMCVNQTSPVNHRPTTLGNPNVGSNCRSSATAQPVPPRPGAPYRAQSGCR